MTRSLLFSLMLALAAPVWAQTSEPSRAEAEVQVHRLEVRDGVVYHDGVALPPSAVPPDVDLRGFDPVAMDYSGDATPVIEVDGRVFALKGNRLVEVQRAASDGDQTQAYAITQARTLGRASEERTPSPSQAEQDYMESLSEQDRALYEQIVRERDMETEALRLAQQYHQAAAPAEREALRIQLREKLGAMFDLKQENRREEVRQMEEALESLRQQLGKRAGMRDRIVEHRLQELIGQ